MSTTVGRHIGIVVVLVLLVGGAALAALPLGVARVRVGHLSLLWWYAVVVAPSAAALVTAVVLVLLSRSSPPSGVPSS